MLWASAVLVAFASASPVPWQSTAPERAYRFGDVLALPGGTAWAVSFAPSGASAPSGVMRFDGAAPDAVASTDVLDVDPTVFGRVLWPRLLLVEGDEQEGRFLWTGSADDHAAGRSRVVAEWSSASGFTTEPPCVLSHPESTRVDWACRVTPKEVEGLSARSVYALGGVRYVYSQGKRSTPAWTMLLERGPTGLVPLSAEHTTPEVQAFSPLLAADRVHVGVTLDVGRPIHAILVQRADEDFELWRLVDGVLDPVELSSDAEAFLGARSREGARLFPFVGTTKLPLLVAAVPLAGHVSRVRLSVHGVAGLAGSIVVPTFVDGLAWAAAAGGDGSPVAVFSADSSDDCSARVVRVSGITSVKMLTGGHCDVLGNDWGEALWLSSVEAEGSVQRFRLLAARHGAFNDRSMIWSHALEFGSDDAPSALLLATVDRLGRLQAW